MDSEDITMVPESKGSVTPTIQPSYPLHVEVQLSPTSAMRHKSVEDAVKQLLEDETGFFAPSEYTGWNEHPTLASNVQRVQLAELPSKAGPSTGLISILPKHLMVRWVLRSQVTFVIYVYQCSDDSPTAEYTKDDNEDVMAADDRVLPAQEWEGLWESLIYADDIKTRLLNYIYTTLVFSDANIPQNTVSWNRLVLLHGPPGTGKTSLAHAIAQKLSIRLSKRYETTRILEINSHSLFSKWFSESGKLVQKLFSLIEELLEDDNTFVAVLIDEVESLTAARAGAVSGSEPSDAVRVVNALLTQLDKLKQHKNVLVMATSNLPDAIDPAFVDRADIIQYVDLPPPEAIYVILRSCLQALMDNQLVESEDIPSLDSLDSTAGHVGQRLLSIAKLCHAQKMSGRSLRRLPVLAHAQCMESTPITLTRHHVPSRKSSHNSATSPEIDEPITPSLDVNQWLTVMERVVSELAVQKKHFGFKTE